MTESKKIGRPKAVKSSPRKKRKIAKSAPNPQEKERESMGQLKGLQTRYLQRLEDAKRLSGLLERAREDLAHKGGLDLPYAKIAKWLNAQGERTHRDGVWYPTTVSRVHDFRQKIIERIDLEFSLQVIFTSDPVSRYKINELSFDKQIIDDLLIQRNYYIMEIYEIERGLVNGSAVFNDDYRPEECRHAYIAEKFPFLNKGFYFEIQEKYFTDSLQLTEDDDYNKIIYSTLKEFEFVFFKGRHWSRFFSDDPW